MIYTARNTPHCRFVYHARLCKELMCELIDTNRKFYREIGKNSKNRWEVQDKPYTELEILTENNLIIGFIIDPVSYTDTDVRDQKICKQDASLQT